jgi:hypothetical protein
MCLYIRHVYFIKTLIIWNLDHDSALAYWNSPQGKRDEEFVSPFQVTQEPGRTKYVTFEPDGGEYIFIFRHLCRSLHFLLLTHYLQAVGTI